MTGQELDLRCIGRLAAGDEGAIAELYDRHAPMLYSLICRIIRVTAEAEDVLQEAWVQVWKRASSYDVSRGTVAAWLLTIARSRAIDRARSLRSRLQAESRSELEPPAAAPALPVADAARRQLEDRVRAALASLSPDQREVLELAYFGGLSQSEIAARCGAPLGTVKSWTRQGLRRLRELVPSEVEA
jgi:RNA polymerase sigma-70 factor (ECF subfamily)